MYAKARFCAYDKYSRNLYDEKAQEKEEVYVIEHEIHIILFASMKAMTANRPNNGVRSALWNRGPSRVGVVVISMSSRDCSIDRI